MSEKALEYLKEQFGTDFTLPIKVWCEDALQIARQETAKQIFEELREDIHKLKLVSYGDKIAVFQAIDLRMAKHCGDKEVK